MLAEEPRNGYRASVAGIDLAALMFGGHRSNSYGYMTGIEVKLDVGLKRSPSAVIPPPDVL